MFIAFPIWLEGLIRSVTDMDGIQVKKVERKKGESDFNFEQKENFVFYLYVVNDDAAAKMQRCRSKIFLVSQRNIVYACI